MIRKGDGVKKSVRKSELSSFPQTFEDSSSIVFEAGIPFRQINPRKAHTTDTLVAAIIFKKRHRIQAILSLTPAKVYAIVNDVTTGDCWTSPLHVAIALQDSKTLKLLLRAHASPYMYDWTGTCAKVSAEYTRSSKIRKIFDEELVANPPKMKESKQKVYQSPSPSNFLSNFSDSPGNDEFVQKPEDYDKDMEELMICLQNCINLKNTASLVTENMYKPISVF